MESTKDKSSILISIFKRKGGEGVATKIINDDNKQNFSDQISSLETKDSPLLCFKQDESNWLLLTNNQIIEERDGVRLVMPYSELIEVTPAKEEELKDKILDKHNFTRLALTDRSDRRYVIRTEKGLPFQGIYQMLHHIVSNNKAPD